MLCRGGQVPSKSRLTLKYVYQVAMTDGGITISKKDIWKGRVFLTVMLSQTAVGDGLFSSYPNGCDNRSDMT